MLEPVEFSQEVTDFLGIIGGIGLLLIFAFIGIAIIIAVYKRSKNK